MVHWTTPLDCIFGVVGILCLSSVWQIFGGVSSACRPSWRRLFRNAVEGESLPRLVGCLDGGTITLSTRAIRASFVKPFGRLQISLASFILGSAVIAASIKRRDDRRITTSFRAVEISWLIFSALRKNLTGPPFLLGLVKDRFPEPRTA